MEEIVRKVRFLVLTKPYFVNMALK